MSTHRIYAMLPQAATEWERRKIEAMAKIPKAELCDDDKQAISDFIDFNKEVIRGYLGMFYNQRRPYAVANGVAFIHVNDFLGGNLTFIDKCLGGSDYADISADIRKAMSDPSVKAVLVDVDSGGGSAVGCVEVGQLLAKLNAEKTVYSFVNSVNGSAAFAISCAATVIYSPPSAITGCIGTILTSFDYAAMLEAEGVGVHIYTNEGADLKAMGHPALRPTDAQSQAAQEMANDYGFQFQAHVLDCRPKMQSVPEAFRGQAVSGREALRLRFIDGIASREEVVAALEGIASAS